MISRVTLVISTGFIITLPRYSASTLFPYTTLFRSRAAAASADQVAVRAVHVARAGRAAGAVAGAARSEEHTSELQSHVNIVCRLLLEKKNVFIDSLILDRNFKGVNAQIIVNHCILT